MRATRLLPSIFALVLLASACGARFPAAPVVLPAGPSAAEILARSVTAAGSDPYESFTDIAVSYRGEWGTFVEILQPALTDVAYRGTSEERVLVRPAVVAQIHEGPGGTKSVLRDSGGVRVAYNGRVSTDRDVVETSALVADGYAMFLLGSAWLKQNGRDWARLEDAALDGRSYYRLRGILRPGVGLSEQDEVVAWIDRETLLLFRVHFTLEGHRNTQGAHADVTFSGYREIHGHLWPTHFVERVRGPVDIHAHEWVMVGLDVNRGLARADLGSPGQAAWSKASSVPARKLSASTP